MSVISAARKDSFASVLEQLVVGATFFVLYGYLIRVVGAEQLGVWSLVMVSVNLGQLANLGIASGLIRSVAKSEGEGDREATVAAIDTALLLTLGIFLTLGLLLYFPFKAYLLYSVSEDHRDLALDLLPYGLIVLVLTNIANVPLSGLGGMQLFRWRSLIAIFSTLAGLLIVLLGARPYGILAASIAFVVQPALSSIAGWYLLRRAVPELSWFPRKFRGAQARELLGFGFQIQLITFAMMFLEPATRLVLGIYGTLDSVTYFTLAWRFIVQARGFVFSAVFVMVPAFGKIGRSQPEQSNPLYERVNRLAAIAGSAVFGGAAAMAPFVSDIWIGQRADLFVSMTIALAIGWHVNALSLGAYVRGLGEGVVSWILGGHILMAVLNIALAYGFAQAFGPIGPVWSLTAALGFSSILYGYATHRRFGLGWKDFITLGDVVSMAIAACGAAAGFYLYIVMFSEWGPWISGFAAATTAGLFMLVMIAVSAQRNAIFGLARSLLGDFWPHSLRR
jgi:O-antigen/teichoic acid export membrane protein